MNLIPGFLSPCLSTIQRDSHQSCCSWLPRYRYSNPGCRPFSALSCAEAASAPRGPMRDTFHRKTSAPIHKKKRFAAHREQFASFEQGTSCRTGLWSKLGMCCWEAGGMLLGGVNESVSSGLMIITPHKVPGVNL